MTTTMTSLPLFHLFHNACQRADQIFASFDAGLTPRQFIVLAAVAGKDGISQTEITRLTGTDRSTMTQLLAFLQTRKYVTRRRPKRDARRYAVSITCAGNDALAAARTAALATDAALLSNLDVSQRTQLFSTLETILKHEGT
jgi:DNA-binding MarR family transcriptional regulator